MRQYQHIQWHPVCLHDVSQLLSQHISPFPFLLSTGMQLEGWKILVQRRRARLHMLEITSQVPCTSCDPLNPDTKVATFNPSLIKTEPPVLQFCQQASDLCLSFQSGYTPVSDLKQGMMTSGTSLAWHSCFVNLALLLCIISLLNSCTPQLPKPESPTSLQTPHSNHNKKGVITTGL